MGWIFPYTTRTRAELVKYLRRPERFGPRLELVRACVKGSRHWYLIREKESGLHWVGLDLMQGARVDGWGYKDLDETVGPTAADCPLSYLDAPHRGPVGYAAQWRERVRRFHAAEKARPALAPGVTLCLSDGRRYTLCESLGRRGWAVVDEGGAQWRMPARVARSATVAHSEILG